MKPSNVNLCANACTGETQAGQELVDIWKSATCLQELVSAELLAQNLQQRESRQQTGLPVPSVVQLSSPAVVRGKMGS